MARKIRRNQNAEIIEYIKLKAAAGGGGASGGGSFYTPGETLTCQVLAKEPGGYSVLIANESLAGFLPTQEKLDLGVMVSAHFVCVHNKRLLLSAKFSTGAQTLSSNS